MKHPRNSVSYEALTKKIVARFGEATDKLSRMGYESQNISPREFYDYMTGETPTGDTITILDVLDNEYLMIHEVVEISELKKRGVPITKQTVTIIHPDYETHYTATEYELNYALDKRDFDWLKVRINHAKTWLEDTDIPQHLIPRCKAIIKKFSEALPQ